MISSLAFTGDGAYLASGNQDETIRVWVVANARPMGQPLAFAPGYLAALVPTADSDRIAAADVTAVLWWPFTPAAWIVAACRLTQRDLTSVQWNQLLPGATRACPADLDQRMR